MTLITTCISEEPITTILRLEIISELLTPLTVSNRLKHTAKEHYLCEKEKHWSGIHERYLEEGGLGYVEGS
jgi:hypothetical protein